MPQESSKYPVPQKVVYTSKDIPIPDSFLTSPSSTPVTCHHIDFAKSPLPQYDGHTALVLDNVLSPDECRELLSLAESSVPREDENESAWKPALVSGGNGYESRAPGYRESDRIIWDQQTIVDRLWERCLQAEGLQDLLAVIPHEPWMKGGKFVFSRLNDRMRFLKYSPGQYFKRKSNNLCFSKSVADNVQLIATVPTTIPKVLERNSRPTTPSISTSTTLPRMILHRNYKAAQLRSLTEKGRKESMLIPKRAVSLFFSTRDFSMKER